MSDSRILILERNHNNAVQLRDLIVALDGPSSTIGSPESYFSDSVATTDVPSAVMLGHSLDQSDRKRLVEAIEARCPNTAIISVAGEFVTASDSLAVTGVGDSAISLPWPPSAKDVARALKSLSLAEAARSTSIEVPRLTGDSIAMRKVQTLIGQVAGSDATVMITGESGTGKEIVARRIHAYSNRSEGPFVAVNCGAIPVELIESELFGHVKGAFTGALFDRTGKFLQANGGTIFLDEIGDMPLDMQVKLLRVLQERTVEPVGSSRAVATDVRIVTATNKDLPEEVAAGRFREDLYYRINVFPVKLPALRDRKEDIPALLDDMIARHAGPYGVKVQLSAAAADALMSYHWPGNIRELSNVVERLAVTHPDGRVEFAGLPERITNPNASQPALESGGGDNDNGDESQSLKMEGVDLKSFLGQVERNLIEQALAKCGGVTAKAAKLLQMQRTTLVEKMRRHGIDAKDYSTG